jgi:hypothetical protein
MRLALISLLMIPMVVGCGKPDCGEGNHVEDGNCVADEESDADANEDGWTQHGGKRN